MRLFCASWDVISDNVVAFIEAQWRAGIGLLLGLSGIRRIVRFGRKPNK
jgi:hypothetical protein